ncbi:hypothetical protein ACYCS5_28305 [Paenibacillus sp. SEL3]
MIPVLQDYLSIPDGTLTWNTRWISDFESPWSIFEKLKYTNLAKRKDIFKLFGNAETLNKKTIIGHKNHDLYKLSAFDELLFDQRLGFKLLKYNETVLNSLVGFLRGGEDYEKGSEASEYHFLEKNLSICMHCIKDGFHSLLHQVEFINLCPFHNSSLINHCPSCKREIPYELSDSYFEHPYLCYCGFTFKKIDSNSPLSSLWGKYSIDDIKNCQVLNWLSLGEQEKNELERVYIYPLSKMSKTPQILTFLLNVSQKQKSPVKLDKFYSSVQSSSNIQFFKHPFPENSFKGYSFEQWSPIDYSISFADSYGNKPLIKEFVKIKSNILNAMSNHLKRTILKHHKTCIRRYVRVSRYIDREETPICPYAEAYVNWKQELLSFKHFYDVDSQPLNLQNRARISDLSVVISPDPLLSILDACIRAFPIEKPQFHSHYKWLISHLIWHIGKQLFISFLRNPNPSIKKFTEERIAFEGHFLAVLFPQKNNEPFVVFWDNKHEWLNDNILSCPYPTVKEKRKSKLEESFHPMQIAIDNLY